MSQDTQTQRFHQLTSTRMMRALRLESKKSLKDKG